MRVGSIVVLFLFLFMVLVTSFPASATQWDDVIAQIKPNCAADWPTDYQMQAYCVGEQRKNATGFGNQWNSFKADSEEKQIMNRCLQQWPGRTGGVDFVMAVYCVGEQLKAYQSLK